MRAEWVGDQQNQVKVEALKALQKQRVGMAAYVTLGGGWDPALNAALLDTVFRRLKRAGLVAGAHRTPLPTCPHGSGARNAWEKGLMRWAGAGKFDVVFCDPDTGLVAPTTPKKKHHEYASLAEIQALAKLGDVVIYQHAPGFGRTRPPAVAKAAAGALRAGRFKGLPGRKVWGMPVANRHYSAAFIVTIPKRRRQNQNWPKRLGGLDWLA